MSFPTFPDIDPQIKITFDEVINLLLASIAMEEFSLSKLMDAETEKILQFLESCKIKPHPPHRYGDREMLPGVTEINKSVNDTVKNLIKMQMLLQFKLDQIQEILPPTSTTTTCTTTHTTTSTTSSCSTTTGKKQPPCRPKYPGPHCPRWSSPGYGYCTERWFDGGGC